MAAGLARWLVALVLLGTLVGSLPTGPTRAQETAVDESVDQEGASPAPDEATETPTPTGTATQTATATETAIPAQTATGTPTETATVAPTETASPEPTGTETATGSPTADATATAVAGSGTPTGTAAPTATGTRTGTPDDRVRAATTPIATATPGQPITLADITVTVSCRRNPETITIANTGGRSIYINSVETMYAPVRGEPFVLEERLRPGRTLVLSMGSRATGRVLTRDAIFTNAAYERDGLILGLSIGTLTRRCPAADPDATPAPEPTQTVVTKSVAVVTTATSLRGAPRSSSPTVRTLPEGATVATTGMAYGRYVSVSYLATRGWALASALDFDTPPPPTGRPATTTDTVNLRSSPSTSAAVLTVLPAGTRVSYTGSTRNGFRSVAHSSMTGWVYGDYLVIQPPGAEEWIDVDRTTRVVTLYRGTTKVATYAAEVSADASSHGFLATAVGTYYVYSMTEGLSYTPYGNSFIRYWVGFDPNRENGFHSWEMDSRGRLLDEASRATSGCVSTPPTIARAIFAFADYGMRVVVHW